MTSVTVRVPATSANLGPGFDAFGLALSWYDEVTVSPADSGVTVEVTGVGADAVPRDESHLVVRSFFTAAQQFGGRPDGVALRCVNRIPHGRGLGSSAAAIVAGVRAAAAMATRPVLDDEVLAVAAEIEGHPDNVAACLLGGVTIAWTESGQSRAVRLAAVADLALSVFVPGQESSTAKARGMLPEQVPHAHAATNAGRAALLVHALTADPSLLFPATEDRLHQEYRALAMPASAELVRALRASDVPAVISGAGPTVLAFGALDLAAWTPDGFEAHAVTLDTTGAHLIWGLGHP